MNKYRTAEELTNVNFEIMTIDGIHYAGICLGVHKTKKKYIIGFFLNSAESNIRNFLLSKQELKTFMENNNVHFHNLYERKDGAIKYADYRPCLTHLADTLKKATNINSCSGLRYEANVKACEARLTQNLYTQNHDVLELQIHLQFDENKNLYTLTTVIYKDNGLTEILRNAISMAEEILLFTVTENLLRNIDTQQLLANAKQRTTK